MTCVISMTGLVDVVPQNEQYELKQTEPNFRRTNSDTDVVSTKSYHSQSSVTTEAGVCQKFELHALVVGQQQGIYFGGLLQIIYWRSCHTVRWGAKTQLHVPGVCLIGSWMQDAGNSMR